MITSKGNAENPSTKRSDFPHAEGKPEEGRTEGSVSELQEKAAAEFDKTGKVPKDWSYVDLKQVVRINSVGYGPGKGILVPNENQSVWANALERPLEESMKAAEEEWKARKERQKAELTELEQKNKQHDKKQSH